MSLQRTELSIIFVLFEAVLELEYQQIIQRGSQVSEEVDLIKGVLPSPNPTLVFFC